MDILFASHTHMGGTFVVGSHQLARALARDGHRILHLSTPVSPFHLPRIFADPELRGRLRRLGRDGTGTGRDRVEQIVPLALLPARPPMVTAQRNLALATMLPSVTSMMDRAGFPRFDLVLVDQPMFVGIQDRMATDLLVYRPTDLYAEMRRDPRVTAIERALLANADAVVSTSRAVDERMAALAPALPRLVLENGVEVDHFAGPRAAPAEYQTIPEPRVVYAGAMDDRFDLDAVRAAAAALPAVHFILIGPARRAPHASGNVHFLGPRPYERLPAYLQHCAIGLLPLTDATANRGRSPMKLFEYLAAGLTVVARTTDELGARALPEVRLYDAAAEMPAAIASALEDPIGRDAAVARAHAASWDGRARSLLSFVGTVRR
jgi:glycosyltransferase involved in cell wall biosynthesis